MPSGTKQHGDDGGEHIKHAPKPSNNGFGCQFVHSWPPLYRPRERVESCDHQTQACAQRYVIGMASDTPPIERYDPADVMFQQVRSHDMSYVLSWPSMCRSILELDIIMYSDVRLCDPQPLAAVPAPLMP